MSTDSSEIEQSEDLNTKDFIMEYIERFKNSPEVTQQIGERLQRARAVEPTVTRDEILEAYLGTDLAKQAFWEFRKTNPFQIAKEQLPLNVQRKIDKYYSQIRKIQSRERRLEYQDNRSLIEQDEIDRSAAHTSVAQQMTAEGLAPNITLGRLITHFIAIQDGMDVVDPERDARRRKAIAKGL